MENHPNHGLTKRYSRVDLKDIVLVVSMARIFVPVGLIGWENSPISGLNEFYFGEFE